MAPGGDGGRFRYFNQLPINGATVSLNRMLDDAEKSGNPELITQALNRIRTELIEDRALLRDSMNTLLIDKVDKEIEQAIKLGVISRDKKAIYSMVIYLLLLYQKIRKTLIRLHSMKHQYHIYQKSLTRLLKMILSTV